MPGSEESRLMKAAALKYDQESGGAPVIVAAGAGLVAQRIIDIAQNSGVPVYHDDGAATMLSKLALGESIPEELYNVVAQIYVSVIRAADESKAAKHPSAPVRDSSLRSE